jgi:hypothetical protein
MMNRVEEICALQPGSTPPRGQDLLRDSKRRFRKEQAQREYMGLRSGLDRCLSRSSYEELTMLGSYRSLGSGLARALCLLG